MFKKVFSLSFLLAFLMVTDVFASALKFSPQRINFDAKNRVFTLNVHNKSDEKRAYRISLETRYLKPEGGSVQMSDDVSLSAVPHLRLTPRRIFVESGASQKIRLQYRGRDIEDGDYVAHIKFTEMLIPEARSKQNDEDLAGMKFEVKQVVNIAVPIRLSVGDVESDVKITGAVRTGFKQVDTEFLDVKFSRVGNGNGEGFLYGRFKSNVATNEKKLPIVIQRVPVNIYRNLDEYTLKAPLLSDIPLENGELILTLHEGEGINRPVIDTFRMEL